MLKRRHGLSLTIQIVDSFRAIRRGETDNLRAGLTMSSELKSLTARTKY